MASDVLNIYESEETLKLLVETLETSDTQAAKEDLSDGKEARKEENEYIPNTKLRSVGQSPGQQNIRFAPIVRSEKKTRNGIVEEWRVEAPLPQDRLIPLETLHQKKNKIKKGKEQRVFENDIKATKAAKAQQLCLCLLYANQRDIVSEVTTPETR